MKKLFLCFLIAILFLCVAGPMTAQDEDAIYVLELKGEITKATESAIVNSIEKANEDGAYAFILALDTPGGRSDSTFNIVEAMQSSDIPIIFFSYPRGAIAASAGTYIAMASNIVAMAPLTTIGAAEPIYGYDPTTGEAIETPEKVREYYTAIMRSYAEANERDTSVAERFVSENLSLTPEEALTLGMCDVIASSFDDLVEQLDGMEIKGTVNGEKITLETEGLSLRFLGLSLKDKILIAISNPSIAYLLTTIGILGLIFGFMSPGWHVPEVIGAICIGLAIIANGYVGFELGGVILMGLGFVFFVVEAMTPNIGLYAIAGVASFVFGSLILFSGTTGGEGRFFDEGSIKMFWTTIIVMTAMISGFLIFGLQAALRLRKSSPTTGKEQMLNEEGVVIEALEPAGTIKIRGEIWKGYSEENIAVGERVKVISIKGLTLIVEKIAEEVKK
ncbi:MAG: nodulation protein NfeD [Candidatus Methanofastidiosa archaeon]|nr:nodulation protein NfeD [Candidatus Methanofastidiosa archaeon]